MGDQLNIFKILLLIVGVCLAGVKTVRADESGCYRQVPDLHLFETKQPPNLFGYRDSAGKVVIEARFSVAMDFEVHAYAFADGYWIDASGGPYVQAYIFDNGPDYSIEGRARFVEEGKVGFLDDCMNKVILARYDFAMPFQNGRAIVCMDCRPEPDGEHSLIVGGRWGAIDLSGKVVVPLIYDDRTLRE